MSESELVGSKRYYTRARSRSKDPAPVAPANGHPRPRRNEKAAGMDPVPEDDMTLPSTPYSSQKSSQRSDTLHVNGTNGSLNGSSQLENGSSQPVNGVHSRPLSPAGAQKEELQHLNHRLQTVFFSRADLLKQNAALKEMIALLEKGQDDALESSLLVLKNEVEKLRAALDQEAGDRAAATILVDKKDKEIRTFQNLLAQERNRLAELKKELERLRDSESNASENRKKLDEALNHVHELKQDLADRERQIADLEKSLENETRQRIEMSNALNTVTERAKMDEKLFQEKTKRLSMPAMDVVDDGAFMVDPEMVERLREEYEDNHYDAIENLEKEHAREVFSLKSQIKALEGQLDDFRDIIGRSSTSQRDHQLEANDLRRENERLSVELRGLREEFDTYQEHTKDRMTKSTETIRGLSERYRILLDENSRLQQSDVELQAELRIYRTLIDEEEKRLSISTPTSAKRPLRAASKRQYDSPVSPGMMDSRYSKKQRSDAVAPRPGSSKYSVSKRTNKAFAVGPVRILEVEPGRVVRVENTGDAVVSLSGCKIIQDSQKQFVQYEFEEGASIGAKSIISVFSPSGNSDNMTTDDLSQRTSDQKWLDARSLQTVLQDAEGNILAQHETAFGVDSPNSDSESISPSSSSRWSFLPKFLRSAGKESNDA